jgi:hypothetical protein
LLDVASSEGGVESLPEALGFAFLVPGRDYPLLTGSYLNDSDRQDPATMANVAAINEVR